MFIAILLLFTVSVALFVLSGLFNRAPSGQLRSSLIAQTMAVTIGALIKLSILLIFNYTNFEIASLFDSIANFSFALGGAIGLSIMTYIRTGKWSRIFLFITLFSLLPTYGIIFCSLIWFAIPILIAMIASADRDPQMRIKLQTIQAGTIGGGLLFVFIAFLRFFDQTPLGMEIVGPLMSVLFIYAGLNVHNDPENEFYYPEVITLVKTGLVILFSISFLPFLLLDQHNGLILIKFLLSAFNLITCFILLLLFMHFDSASIKTFFVLLILAIMPEIGVHLYSEQLEVFLQNGLHLISRTFLVMSCLFILKQYLRWGFEIVQSMVMLITAVSAASIVFLVIYIFEPSLPLSKLFTEEKILHNGFLFMNFVVLFSLPPVLLNYSLGTMRVTWSILTLGVFLVVYSDFLPTEIICYEHNVSELIGTSLIMLAFMTLWRYINSMIQKIHSLAQTFDEK